MFNLENKNFWLAQCVCVWFTTTTIGHVVLYARARRFIAAKCNFFFVFDKPLVNAFKLCVCVCSQNRLRNQIRSVNQIKNTDSNKIKKNYETTKNTILCASIICCNGVCVCGYPISKIFFFSFFVLLQKKIIPE